MNQGRIVDINELEPDMSPETYPHHYDRITRMMIAVLARADETKGAAFEAVVERMGGRS